MDINIVDYQYRKSVRQSFSHSIDLLHVTHSSYSPPLETRRKLGLANVRKEFWDCYWGQGKKIANS